MRAPSNAAFAEQGEWVYACKKLKNVTDIIHETVNKESQKDDRKMAALPDKAMLPAGFTAHDNRKIPAPSNAAVPAQGELVYSVSVIVFKNSKC